MVITGIIILFGCALYKSYIGPGSKEYERAKIEAARDTTSVTKKKESKKDSGIDPALVGVMVGAAIVTSPYFGE
jgi:hypothetical protein